MGSRQSGRPGRPPDLESPDGVVKEISSAAVLFRTCNEDGRALLQALFPIDCCFLAAQRHGGCHTDVLLAVDAVMGKRKNCAGRGRGAGGVGSKGGRFENPPVSLMKTWLASGHLHCFDAALQQSEAGYFQQFSVDLLTAACTATASAREPSARALHYVLTKLSLDPNESLSEKETVISFLAKSGDTEKLRVALQCGADPNFVKLGSGGNTALHSLCEDITQCCPKRTTADQCEKLVRDVSLCIELLCAHGADLNRLNYHNLMPLESLVEACVQDVRECQALKEARAGFVSVCDDDRITLQAGCSCLLQLSDNHTVVAKEVFATCLRHGARWPRPPHAVGLHDLLGSGYGWLVSELVEQSEGGCLPTNTDSMRRLLQLAVSVAEADVVHVIASHGCMSNQHQSQQAVALDEKEPEVHSSVADHSSSAQDPNQSRKREESEDLLMRAVQRGSVEILRALNSAGIPIADAGKEVLFEAALLLDRSVFTFLIESCRWKPDDVRNALKLNSALLVLAHASCALPLRWNSNTLWSMANLRWAQNSRQRFENTVSFLDEARKVFQEVNLEEQKEESVVADFLDNRFKLGDVTISEATTMMEYDRLSNTTVIEKFEHLALHIHAFLVMRRLIPGHCMFAAFAQVIGAQFFDHLREFSTSTTMPDSADRRMPDQRTLFGCYELLMLLVRTCNAYPQAACFALRLLDCEFWRGVALTVHFSLLADSQDLALQPVLAWLASNLIPAATTEHDIATVTSLFATLVTMVIALREADAELLLKPVVSSMIPSTKLDGVFYAAFSQIDVPIWEDSAADARSKSKDATHYPGNVTDHTLALVTRLLTRCGLALPKLASSALHLLLDQNLVEVVCAMVQCGEEAGLSLSDHVSLLTKAVQKCDASTVRSLLQAGCAAQWRHSLVDPDPDLDGTRISSSPGGSAEACHAEDEMTELPTLAALRNDADMLTVLAEAGIVAEQAGTMYAAAAHCDGRALEVLLQTHHCPTDVVIRALQLHCSLTLMQACLCQANHAEHNHVLMESAQKSFNASLPLLHDASPSAVPAQSETNRHIMIRKLGVKIAEASSEKTYQDLMHCNIPSLSGRALSAVHLHGLLVLERLGDQRCGRYFSAIIDCMSQEGSAVNQLDSLDTDADTEDRSPESARTVQGDAASAIYDVILHLIQVSMERDVNGQPLFLRLVLLAKQISALLPRLVVQCTPSFPDLESDVSIVPIFDWLSDINLPVCQSSAEWTYLMADLFVALIAKTKEAGSALSTQLQVAAERIVGTDCIRKHSVIQVVLDEILTHCHSIFFWDSKHGGHHASIQFNDSALAAMVELLVCKGLTMPTVSIDSAKSLLQRKYFLFLGTLISSGSVDPWQGIDEPKSLLWCVTVGVLEEDVYRASGLLQLIARLLAVPGVTDGRSVENRQTVMWRLVVERGEPIFVDALAEMNVLASVGRLVQCSSSPEQQHTSSVHPECSSLVTNCRGRQSPTASCTRLSQQAVGCVLGNCWRGTASPCF